MQGGKAMQNYSQEEVSVRLTELVSSPKYGQRAFSSNGGLQLLPAWCVTISTLTMSPLLTTSFGLFWFPAGEAKGGRAGIRCALRIPRGARVTLNPP